MPDRSHALQQLKHLSVKPDDSAEAGAMYSNAFNLGHDLSGRGCLQDTLYYSAFVVVTRRVVLVWSAEDYISG